MLEVIERSTEVVEDQFQSSITFLNMSGDITISWDEENKARILELVKKKMDEGYVFFTLQKVPLLPIMRRKAVTDKNVDNIKSLLITDEVFDELIDDMEFAELQKMDKNSRKLRESQLLAEKEKQFEEVVKGIDDQDVAVILRDKKGRFMKRQDKNSEMVTGKRCKTPEEVIEKGQQSLAMKKISGG